MPRAPRVETFEPNEVAIVHCVQRCVRRAYLAGVDAVSGQNYDFRREWIRRRLELLASVFGIDVLTYAILSNHLHVVTRTRPDVIATWSDREAAIRWLRVFPGRRLDEQLAEPTSNDVDMLVNNKERLALVRSRLSDLSWFMRALSEPIARMANRFDECTGRFWEGRFKAQRIADEAGLLACSMYVDLNPVRAAMAASPEQSIHTSAYDRIEALKGTTIDSAAADLSVIDREEAGRKIVETPVDQLKAERIAKRRGARLRSVAINEPQPIDDDGLINVIDEASTIQGDPHPQPLSPKRGEGSQSSLSTLPEAGRGEPKFLINSREACRERRFNINSIEAGRGEQAWKANPAR
jgi:hypothetical protein